MLNAYFANSLNYGSISFSYYYNGSKIDDTNQSKVASGALAVSDVDKQDSFYGFSFASSFDEYDGIWTFDKNGLLTLVSPNQSDELANKIEWLFNLTEEEYAKQVEYAIKKSSDYSIDEYYAKLMNVYEEVLA